MDARSNSIHSRKRKHVPRKLPEEAGCSYYMPSLCTTSLNPSEKCYGDRFIPVRSAMDMDIAHYLLTEPNKDKKNRTASTSKGTYQRLLAEKLFNNKTRIFSFRNKPPELEVTSQEHCSETIFNATKYMKQHRHILQRAERTLCAPNLIDDYYLNLLDWGSNNVLSIALDNTVYLWDASNGSASELVTINADSGPVTSISWAPNGPHIAIGLNSSDIQLWDTNSNRLLRTLRGVHRSRVGSMAWNKKILTTGGQDGKILNNDIRIRSHVVATYRGHRQEVCGLKWSESGRQLASGGNENLLHIWDVSMASSFHSAHQNQWLHRLDGHSAAVKALAWCPSKSNLLASGGGTRDQCIKFWNTNTGALLSSVETGSQVCSLLWDKNKYELLSSHGHGGVTENQLILWNYPSMEKMAELSGHTSRVLFLAQSPDGGMVVSASADETLKFWNVFEAPETPKHTARTENTGILNSFNHIR